MIWPAPLERGSRIALVAASRRVRPGEVRPFLDFAQLQGWKVEYDRATLFAAEGILAGSDALRLQVLQEALDAPDLKAIWFARGGYGSSRLWASIDWAGFRRCPKWLIGFSDITPLLWGAVQQGAVALHAPVATYLPHRTHTEAINALLRLLRAEGDTYRLRWARRPVYSWRVGMAQGPLIGGNLSLLQTLCGTPLDLHTFTQSPILFWEEISEYFYRLDRMSWHLRNAGWYAHAASLLVGDVSQLYDEEEAPFGRTVAQIVRESTEGLVPLAMGLPVGHCEHNYPLPLGVTAELTVGERGAELVCRR